MEQPESPTFSDDILRYATIIWDRAWLIIFITVIIGLIAYVINNQSSPIYQATTTILINEAPATKITDYSAVVTSERLAQTYAQLMSKKPVIEGVIEKLAINISSEKLVKNLFIQPIRDTTLIEVSYEDNDPQQAMLVTNTIFEIFAKQNQEFQASRYAASKNNLETQLKKLDVQIQKESDLLAALVDSQKDQSERERLETNLSQYRQTYAYLLQSYEQVRLAEAQSTSNIVQVEPASLPEIPIRPRIWTNTILAMVVGFFLTVGGIFLFESLDDRLKGPDEIVNRFGLPVLGYIPKYEFDEKLPITCMQPRGPVSEAFRSLRTNIQFSSTDTILKTLLITSPSPGEGKSTIAINLGIVVAQGNRKVVVVDADLRRPKIHEMLGIDNQPGLSDLFVVEEKFMTEFLQPTCSDNINILVSGDPPPNPSELLGSQKMLTMLSGLSLDHDVILIDSPPLLAVTDAVVLAPIVDGVLIVVKPGSTLMNTLKKSIELLHRADAKILGFVMNGVDIGSRWNYYYRGYYDVSYIHNSPGKKENKVKGYFHNLWKKGH